MVSISRTVDSAITCLEKHISHVKNASDSCGDKLFSFPTQSRMHHHRVHFTDYIIIQSDDGSSMLKCKLEIHKMMYRPIFSLGITKVGHCVGMAHCVN